MCTQGNLFSRPVLINRLTCPFLIISQLATYTTISYLQKPGDHSRVVTPDPISNSEVKHSCADDTADIHLWKSRLSPGFLFIYIGPENFSCPSAKFWLLFLYDDFLLLTSHRIAGV